MFRAAAARLRAPTPHEVHRRAAVRMLATLGLAPPFTLDDVHRAVARHRGARIHLVAWPLPPAGPSGLWISGSQAEYVFYPDRAPTLARVVIVGHELGHIAFNDGATAGDLVELATMLMPGLDPALLARPAGRGSYHADVERRAEVFGTVVAEHVGSWSGPRCPDAQPTLLRELSATLEAVRVHG